MDLSPCSKNSARQIKLCPAENILKEELRFLGLARSI